MVRLNDRANDGEPEPAPRCRTVVTLLKEPFKCSISRIFAHPGPVVRNGDRHIVTATLQADLHRRLSGGMCPDVAQQIVDDLAQAVRIAGDAVIAVRASYRDRTARLDCAGPGNGLFDNAGEINFDV